MVAVSEGIHYADGTFVSEAKTSGTDGFGHAQLGGLAALPGRRDQGQPGRREGPRHRAEPAAALRRSLRLRHRHGRGLYCAGKAAVEAAVSGVTDKMVGFECTRDANGYHCEPKLFDLSLVANTEKKVPREWINAEGNGVTQGFIDYCLPLIQGETEHGQGRRPAPVRPPEESLRQVSF